MIELTDEMEERREESQERMQKILVHCCAGEDKGENNPFILLELSGCVHRGDSLFVGVGKFLHDMLLVFLLQYRNLRISHSYRKSERTLTQRRAKYRERETMKGKKAFSELWEFTETGRKRKTFYGNRNENILILGLSDGA